MFIYFVLIYCNVEDFKLFSFHKSLVEAKSLPTVLQTAKNNIDLGSTMHEARFDVFFQELVSILDLDLDNILSAISTTTQLKNQNVLNLTNTTTAKIGLGIHTFYETRLHISKHLKGLSGPRVSNVTVLHHSHF